jgi:hypothetical protein
MINFLDRATTIPLEFSFKIYEDMIRNTLPVPTYNAKVASLRTLLECSASFVLQQKVPNRNSIMQTYSDTFSLRGAVVNLLEIRIT